jgi:prepilin-type N-terminal cleavage/methylation domain-containing protein
MTRRFERKSPRLARRGFTLVEIMIRLIIFGLLLSAALPAYCDWIAPLSSLLTNARCIADRRDLAPSEVIERVSPCK